MSKFKFKSGQEKISGQEMSQQMNFDRFLSGRRLPVKAGFKGIKLLATVGVAVATVFTAGYLLFSSPGKTEKTATVPLINPPVKKLDVPATRFVINNSKDTSLLFATGSQLHIPADIFAGQNGKPVSGKIEIAYREFHDPVDILLSGIPMQYDSAGFRWLLESGGMFEIGAMQDGKPLSLLPGKALTVDMISHTNGNDYNIYYLDTAKKAWDYISENNAANKTCTPVFTIDKEKEKALIAATTREPAPAEPLLPGPAKNGAFHFKIDYFKSDFPELAMYDGVKFEIVPGENHYDPKLSEKTWEDVLVRKAADNENYTITFSSENESHTFDVRPVVEGKNYEAVKLDYEKKHRIYEMLLSERKQRLDKKRDSIYRINDRIIGLVEQSSLNERFNNFITGTYSSTSKDLLVYRTFNIRRLGIWNCDRPWDFFDEFVKVVNGTQDGEKAYYAAQFSDKSGQKINMKTAFLVKRGVNSAFPVSEGNFKNKFPYKKEFIDLVVGVGFDNKIYLCRDEELNNVISGGKTLSFRMKKIDQEASTCAELKSILNL